uniref:Uncharacterized protein n=1 Tax=Arion vulgaris TaxID=1028688 RepID=A0A0B6ZAK0_9EUPU
MMLERHAQFTEYPMKVQHLTIFDSLFTKGDFKCINIDNGGVQKASEHACLLRIDPSVRLLTATSAGM